VDDVRQVRCSYAGGPPPQPGTPAFFRSGARASHNAGDFTRTDDQLQQILAGDNQFVTRARAWDIPISAGLAQGHTEMADAFEAGARLNRANPAPFRRLAIAERSFANGEALQFAGEVGKFIARDKDPNVALTFRYPAGSLAQPAALGKISSGLLVQDSERESLQTAMLQRGVSQAVCMALDSQVRGGRDGAEVRAGGPRARRVERAAAVRGAARGCRLRRTVPPPIHGLPRLPAPRGYIAWTRARPVARAAPGRQANPPFHPWLRSILGKSPKIANRRPLESIT